MKLFLGVISTVFFLNSCCKCGEDLKHSTSVLVKDFPLTEIESPKIIYLSNQQAVDTVLLALDTTKIGVGYYQLIAEKTLKYIDLDWKLYLNDTTMYRLTSFSLGYGSMFCCHGTMTLKSYEINGEKKTDSKVIIDN